MARPLYPFLSCWRYVLLALAAAYLGGCEKAARPEEANDDEFRDPAYVAIAFHKAFYSGSVDGAQRPLVVLLQQMAAARTAQEGPADYIHGLFSRLYKDRTVDPELSGCLMTNWRIAHDFGLLTAENLELMKKGTMPVITIGSYKGKEVSLIGEPARSDSGHPYTMFKLVPSPLNKALTQAAEEPASWRRSPARTVATKPPATSAPAVQFADLAQGSALSLASIGAGRGEISIQSASMADGIIFAVQDRYGFVKRYRSKWQEQNIPGTSETGVYLTSLNGSRVYMAATFAAGQNRYRLAVVGN